MIPRAEAQVQIARLLGDDALRSAPVDVLRRAVHDHVDVLAEALVAEVAESDDVFDKASGLTYLEQRLDALAEFVGPAVRLRLLDAARERIEQW